MDKLTIDFTITPDTIISVLGVIVTIIISVIGGLYVIITNTKKYELTESFRAELLAWYTDTVRVMIHIIHYVKSGEWHEEKFKSQKISLLAQLSAQTELGRFYFPNIIKGDGFGRNKPSAYRGYRHINLEFLLHFYELAFRSTSKSSVNKLWVMERNFTSMIFDMIEPRKRNKRYSKYTELEIPKGRAIEDFYAEDPKNKDIFWDKYFYH